MSLKRPKRPSSARRNIKHETFSPFVSATRLRHVQALLNDGTKSKQGCPDAILCISGIDSRYNDGMLELINYLLFGFFEVRKAELEGSGFDEEVIDDVLMVIQHDQVDVYCNPVNYHYLLPYVSHWRNVAFHCLTDEEYEDEEAAEDFKITTFVNLVKSCHRIGIPYSNSANILPFNKMIIEKWPIIQVYGVEGIGGGGFFTMKHEVVDVSTDVSQVYQHMDPVMLETVIVEQMSKLERQWNTMLSTVEVTLGSTCNLTEEKILEPLKSFYIHGRAWGNGDELHENVPFVLFGSHTKREVLQTVMKGGNSSATDLKSTTVGANGANFMICKAVSPRGPVTCSRTYFFHREFVNPFQDAKLTAFDKNVDLRILTILYSAMVDSVLTAIHAYSQSFSVKEAEKVAKDTLLECCSGIIDGVVTKYLKDRPQLEFSLQTVDNDGRYVKLVEGQRSLSVKCASIVVYDIPSSERSGSTLGSLVFSESFIDSTIRIKNLDGSSRTDSTYMLLTDHISRHKTWSYTDVASDRKLLESKLAGDSLGEGWGKLLLSGEPVHLGSGNILCLPPEEADLYAYEYGLVVISPHSGAMALHNSHIKSVQFYDGDSSNTVAVLVIEYHPTFVPYIPFHLQSDVCQIALLFTPKTKSYQQLYAEVLHNWKLESDRPKVITVEDIPEGCQLMQSMLQHKFVTAASALRIVPTALQKAAIAMPYLNSFLDHFAASSVGSHPIPEQDLSKVLQQVPSSQEDDYVKDVEIVVTILAGVPGSHQDKLCDVLSNLSKDQNRYVILKPPLDDSQSFNPVDIQAKLKATLNVHRRRKQTQFSSRNTRVLYIIPGYTDIVSVIQAIENHPDADVRSHCAIGSITTCVDPLNTFMEHMYTLPHLLGMCAQGWVNQIIMTSSTSLKNEDLDAIQHMLRSVNSNVAFLLAEKGQVSRSMDIDAILSEESFNQADLVRARHLMCPGFTHSVYRPTKSLMTTVQLKFNLPLDRNKLTRKLKDLKTSHVSFPFSSNVYYIQGKVRFVGSKTDEPQELHYCVLSGSLELATLTETAREKAANPGNFISFTGCDLTQAKLKDWLRECAPQKPEKKSRLTKKDITLDVRKRIHKEHHLDTLPEGWFYNGTQYVCFDGSKQDTHPEIDNFIQAYLDEKNAAIDEHNITVEQLVNSYKDLFS